MEINRTDGVSGPGGIGPKRVTGPKAPEAAAPAAAPRDRVEISNIGKFLDAIRQVPDVRADRVQELRKAIQSGKYETPEKMRTAIDRFLEEIGGR